MDASGVAGFRPVTFVSSTYFDLKQIRVDVRHFLEDELGHSALLSEQRTFPVDPSRALIENCVRSVQRQADLFVLIIGTRYGSEDERTSKSVTNLEYLAARAKQIPIYAFVDRSILTLLPLWEKNPTADFSESVDNVALFQFTREVRTEHGVWMHEFERAGDIIETLRSQLAFLFKDALDTSSRLRRNQNEAYLSALGSQSLRIALERPAGWEYLLFSQVLIEEVDRAGTLALEHRDALAITLGEDVDEPFRWLGHRFKDLKRLVDGLHTLFEVSFPREIAPPGTPANAAGIVFVASRIAAIHREILNWARRVRTANVDDEFHPLIEQLATFGDDAIAEIEKFGPSIRDQVNGALALPEGHAGRSLKFTLKLALSNDAGFYKELERLRAKLNL